MNANQKPRNLTRPILARLLFIRERIQSETYPNCRSLADELEVSKRTIERDIEFLLDYCNDPIWYDPSRKGFCNSWTTLYGTTQPKTPADLDSFNKHSNGDPGSLH